MLSTGVMGNFEKQENYKKTKTNVIFYFVSQIIPQIRPTSWWRPDWGLCLSQRASTLSLTSEYKGYISEEKDKTFKGLIF